MRTITIEVPLTSQQADLLEESLDAALYEFGFEEVWRRLRGFDESVETLLSKRGEHLRAEGRRLFREWERA